MDRKDLQKLSRVRLKEAGALLQLQLFDGAYYLAGYAVECAIKACIAKGMRRYEFPDKKKADSSYSHKLRDLLGVAGLENAYRQHIQQDPRFGRNWQMVESWSEQSRYQRHTPQKAKELLRAIKERQHGVISWLKLHW